ncbi:hypothetical protein AMAG_20203 [Allomyces macrogynus ATCC 38327]|uniref:Uncharacterized protein n=1 Tax=Allomyces macrogynus (strain ATCC 38327) TaxID=578462 RepID=A0A0L0T859_ALLM3|nr:hypothetical protein AMAG_20203 [Allomyces macrogynus ATCC 38327]|eukprot:KNE70891.1 hypothetical protein AMAG_20203 [Allomyces macrogynus ATCC 38327]
MPTASPLPVDAVVAAPSVPAVEDAVKEVKDEVPTAASFPVDAVEAARSLSAAEDAVDMEPLEQMPIDQEQDHDHNQDQDQDQGQGRDKDDDDDDSGVESDGEASGTEQDGRHTPPSSPSFTPLSLPTSPQLLPATWDHESVGAAAARASSWSPEPAESWPSSAASTPTSSPARASSTTAPPFMCIMTMSPPRSPLSEFLDDKENIPPGSWPPALLPTVLLPSAHITVLDQSALPSPRSEEPLETLRDAWALRTERKEQDEDVEDHAIVGQLFSGVARAHLAGDVIH